MLIQTKLNRPPLPVDMVYRPRLTQWLKRNQRRPLTLVSAPAGYGKSTLTSCWLSAVDCPTAWVSLDEHDNQLGNFLSYFLAGIQTIFPDSLPETQVLLMVTPQPSITAIAHTLINELNQIGENFILVLDDYHLIDSQAVHDLLSELLAYPPHNFHLVLNTRMDPPLPLITLRAKNQMTEIRIQDLRFTQEETQQLFEEMIGTAVNLRDIETMNAQAEGWVTGLRLAALAWHHRIGVNAIAGEFSAHNRYVSEYLFNEILERQATTLANCLLKTSILERFCADLCERICFSEEEHSGHESVQSDFSGARFVEWLQASNLFVIPLDDQREWYRYHHLFQDFLQQQLAHRFGQEDVTKLHAVAGRWFADHDLIEESLYHLLAARDYAAAIQLIAEQRCNLMNTIQWPRLERWLSLFPLQVVESSAELWMSKTWLVYQRGQWDNLPGHIQHTADLLGQESDPVTANRLAGEICTLRSLIAYHQTNVERTISLARESLELVPPAFWIVRVLARLYLAGGLLMFGDEIGGLDALYSAFKEEKVQHNRFKGTLLMCACYIHWLVADLHGLVQAAKQAILMCQEVGHLQILRLANYHLGCARYQQNDLPAAEHLFASVTNRPYQNYGTAFTNSVCGLAITYQVQGKDAEADQIIERAIAFYLETGNTTQLPIIQALQAEVTLRQGKLGAASRWTEKLDPIPPFTPVWGPLAPHLTLVKVWLAQNTSDSRKKAANLVKRIQEYFENTHNTRFLIETLALKALLEVNNSNQSAALDGLEKALRLAQPGGFIRVFVDMGPEMARLLTQIEVENGLREYVLQIRSAFPELQQNQKALDQDNLLDPLTEREFQILELLQARLTNKEIAARLVISSGTVKGHTIKIYQKLGVKGRRKAVEKAIVLGILTPQ